jgi:hypothetical protein
MQYVMLLERYLVYARDGLVSIDVVSGDRKYVAFDSIVNMGSAEGTRVLVKTDLREGSKVRTKAVWFDAKTVSVETLSENLATAYAGYRYYQGPRLFATRITGESSAMVVEIDTRTGQEVRQLMIPGVSSDQIEVQGISYDKRLLLLRSWADGHIRTYDIEAGVVVGKATGRGGSPSIGERGFVSNAVTFEITVKGGAVDLYDIRGRYLDTVEFLVKEEHHPLYLRFSTDMRYMLLMRPGNRTYDYLVYDLEPFLEYLNGRGYRFAPTSGTAVASGVRVREYANLQAETLGELAAGDELEVLDRSGTKVRIGDQEAWWYKVRRAADGLEGWSYGAYIEVESEQPEPAPSSTSAPSPTTEERRAG